MPVEDKLSMKEKLIETADKLKEHGIDVKETPALFRWIYDERPEVLYQLMISDAADEESIKKEELH
jgi:hypothetical protein